MRAKKGEVTFVEDLQCEVLRLYNSIESWENFKEYNIDEWPPKPSKIEDDERYVIHRDAQEGIMQQFNLSNEKFNEIYSRAPLFRRAQELIEITTESLCWGECRANESFEWNYAILEKSCLNYGVTKEWFMEEYSRIISRRIKQVKETQALHDQGLEAAKNFIYNSTLTMDDGNFYRLFSMSNVKGGRILFANHYLGNNLSPAQLSMDQLKKMHFNFHICRWEFSEIYGKAYKDYYHEDAPFLFDYDNPRDDLFDKDYDDYHAIY